MGNPVKDVNRSVINAARRYEVIPQKMVWRTS